MWLNVLVLILGSAAAFGALIAIGFHRWDWGAGLLAIAAAALLYYFKRIRLLKIIHGEPKKEEAPSKPDGRRNLNARVEGYDGPHFPDVVDELNELVERANIHGGTLKRVVEEMGGKLDLFPVTSDRYTWYRGATIPKCAKSIMILFPWRQNFDGGPDNQRDYSVGIYVQGIKIHHPVVVGVLNTLVSRLAGGVAEDQ